MFISLAVLVIIGKVSDYFGRSSVLFFHLCGKRSKSLLFQRFLSLSATNKYEQKNKFLFKNYCLFTNQIGICEFRVCLSVRALTFKRESDLDQIWCEITLGR